MGGGSRAALGARRFSVLPPNGKMSSVHRRRRRRHRGRRPSPPSPSSFGGRLADKTRGDQCDDPNQLVSQLSESVSQLVRCRSARNAIDLIFTAQRFRSKE